MKKFLSLLLVLSLCLSGVVIPNKADAADLTSAPVTLLDKTPTALTTTEGIASIYEMGTFSPSVYSGLGAMTSNGKVVVNFDAEDLTSILVAGLSEGTENGNGFGFRYSFTLDAPTLVKFNSSYDFFTDNYFSGFDTYLYLSDNPTSLGVALADDVYTSGKTGVDFNYEERNESGVSLAKGTYYVTCHLKSLRKIDSDYIVNGVVESPVFTLDCTRNIASTFSERTVDVGGVLAYSAVENTPVKISRTIFESIAGTDSLYLVYDSPQDASITYEATSADGLYMTLLNADLTPSTQYHFLWGDSDTGKFTVKAGRNIFKLHNFDDWQYAKNNTTLTLKQGVVISTPPPVYNTPIVQTPSTRTPFTQTPTQTVSKQETLKFLPYISAKFVGKSLKKVKVTVGKVKGVKVSFKWKGKTYTKKTNKKGEATFTVKKKFVNGKKFKLTATKKGYRKSTKTYTVHIYRF